MPAEINWKIQKVLAIMISAFALLIFFSSRASAADAVKLSIKSDKKEVKIGDTVVVTVTFSEPLLGYTLGFQFWNGFFEILSVDAGDNSRYEERGSGYIEVVRAKDSKDSSETSFSVTLRALQTHSGCTFQAKGFSPDSTPFNRIPYIVMSTSSMNTYAENSYMIPVKITEADVLPPNNSSAPIDNSSQSDEKPPPATVSKGNESAASSSSSKAPSSSSVGKSKDSPSSGGSDVSSQESAVDSSESKVGSISPPSDKVSHIAISEDSSEGGSSAAVQTEDKLTLWFAVSLFAVVCGVAGFVFLKKYRRGKKSEKRDG